MKKTEMEHGKYYRGRCRNATVARWNGEEGRFYHFRRKFGFTYVECINHEDDFDGYDTFIVEAECEPTDPPIPFEAVNG